MRTVQEINSDVNRTLGTGPALKGGSECRRRPSVSEVLIIRFIEIEHVREEIYPDQDVGEGPLKAPVVLFGIVMAEYVGVLLYPSEQSGAATLLIELRGDGIMLQAVQRYEDQEDVRIDLRIAVQRGRLVVPVACDDRPDILIVVCRIRVQQLLGSR